MAVGSGVVTTRTWSAQRVKLRTLGLMPAPVSIRMMSLLGFKFGQGGDEALAVVVGEVGHTGQARSAADESESAGAVDHHVGQVRVSARDDVRQIGREIDVAEDIGVGEAEVGVHENDAFSGGGELDRQIDGDIAFAHAALAAGDGDDGGAG